MEDTGILTPMSCRYQLRSRTPTTPNTPSTPKKRILRSTSTPVTGDKIKKETVTPLKTPSYESSPLRMVNGVSEGMTNSPVTPAQRLKWSLSEDSGGKPEGNLVFKRPMEFKPRLVGNKPVPSPSRQEIWKQQLGFTDDSNVRDENDKENTTDDDDDDQKCQTSHVEYRALQRVLNERNTQRDESLLQIKNCKDKIRHYKSRLEREENTKRQQLKILKKGHECQLQEKDKLLDNLEAIVAEQEERIRELEESRTTPRRRVKQAETQDMSVKTVQLIDEIKRLQTDKISLNTQLNEVQLELSTVREESTLEVEQFKQRVSELERSKPQNESSQVLKSRVQPALSTPCTDTEKHVEFLQAENDRLFQELSDMKSAHTKALTVSKLNGHRQQQLEEELQRNKTKIKQLEEKLQRVSDVKTDIGKYQGEITGLEDRNMELEQQVRELQAQVFNLNAKSPEVVKVTKVKEVESEKLKKQYEESREVVKDYKQKLHTETRERHVAQTQIKHLEKMVESLETEKADSHAKIWTEVESVHKEHQTYIQSLKERLEEDKLEEIKKVENRITYEHKNELHQLTVTLNKKHSAEVETFMSSLDSLKDQHRTELAKVEADRANKVAEVEKAKTAKVQEVREEMETLTSKQEEELRKLREDFEIAKKAALLKLKEELNREANLALQSERQKLENEHQEALTELEEQWRVEKDEAVRTVREETFERMSQLENQFTDIQGRLLLLNPVLSQFVESYILLQKEVKAFPKVIEKTVLKVKKEMTEAIQGISEYNKELVVKYQKEMKLRKKYHNELVELKGNIRVFCRVRPIIQIDGQGPSADSIVTVDTEDDGLLHVNSKGRTQTFDMDKVFDESSTQEQIFEEVKALVVSCVDGYNVCIFAYGQTGSGKTYTMEGTRNDPGINQRALCLLFEEVLSRQVDWEYSITVSVIEIYNEMIRDLLGEDATFKMEVKMNPDGGFHIPGLSYVTVSTVSDVNQCFKEGQQNRATASTNMNEHSSRSHCLLCVTVTGINRTTGVKSTGKLNLVDLAGSERVSKSKADGARLKEAQNINKSLSCLADVIYALRSRQSYIPYRNSKLTYMLQDSLGGDSKTLMITQVAPIRRHEGETICSLNFAQRVRNVELGAASRKLENGEINETEASSPARQVVPGQRGNLWSNGHSSPARTSSPARQVVPGQRGNLRSGDHSSPARTVLTPQSKLANKPNTPSSSSKSRKK